MRSLLCLLLLAVIPAGSQNVNPGYPVEVEAQKHVTPHELRERLANLELQKDAQELSELCASIPKDMDGLKQGLVAKDALEKLKRVERLSKRVREQLARTSAVP